MSSNKFFKNLFQSLCFFLSILVFTFFLLIGFYCSLYYENGNGEILLVTALILILSFFVFGWYWIFQTVEINQKGITIKIFKKTIRTIYWDSILDIKCTNVMKNPSYTIIVQNDKKLNLDRRKKIASSLEMYGNRFIKDKIKTFACPINSL